MAGDSPAYRTPQALEMAVKAAAKASPMDTGRTIESFWLHRLLCRVFSDSASGFVLKGGRAMLARTVDARATRDIDLLAEKGTLDDAVCKLKELAETDLGDHIRFEFDSTRPIKAEDEYRDGLNVSFIPWLGAKRMQPISIDLVVDEIPLERVERMAPADRIEIRGIKTCDYLVYPAEAALADKLCAIIERHGDRPSSRVKDLVDIVIYALSADIDGSTLQRRLRREAGARALTLPDAFQVPDEWHGPYGRAYARLAAGIELLKDYKRMESAESLAGGLFDPALRGEADGLTWNHRTTIWEHWEKSDSGALPKTYESPSPSS